MKKEAEREAKQQKDENLKYDEVWVDKAIDPAMFSEVHQGYDQARTRASRLEADAVEQGEAGRNPTTSVWRLTESIRKK